MSEHQIQDLSHAQYLAADGVSNSMLAVIREKTPMHLRWQMHNPGEPTEAQIMGTLVHAAILLPDDKPAFHVRPQGLDMRTKDGKEWAAEHADLPCLSSDAAASIDAMRMAVHRHPTASRLLKNADYERSLFVKDDAGTLRKLRPDILPHGGNILPDLKTCIDASESEFSKSIANYGYYCQAAYYLDGCKLAGRAFQNFAFIAVEKTPPYAVAVYVLDFTAVEYGRRLYQRDLQVYRNCVESGVWPGYSDTATCIGLPPWLAKEAEQI